MNAKLLGQGLRPFSELTVYSKIFFVDLKISGDMDDMSSSVMVCLPDSNKSSNISLSLKNCYFQYLYRRDKGYVGFLLL